VVVLLQGGVKYDEKFSCVCLRYGEGHVFWISSGNVFSHCVSNVRGEGPGLVLWRKCSYPLRTCADFKSSIANLFVNETPGGHILLLISL
jgi:hypothetical protein